MWRAEVEAAYTIEPTERDTQGRQVYVSAEKCVSIARFVSHACCAKTHFLGTRGIST